MIPKHATWDVQDSTKIQCFMECPRKYFYDYVLGWQPESPNVHLVFGEAWHIAMETLLLYGYSQDAIDLASLKLEKKYREHFSPSTDDTRYPKTPGFAHEMLKSYCRKYADDHARMEVLYTEVSGSVSIGVASVYFKTDSIIRGTDGWWKDKIFSLEHKTTGQHSSRWAQQWMLKMQTGVYTHVLYCLFPASTVHGVIINTSIFQKTKPDHTRIDVPRTADQMEVWLWNTRHWLRQIKLEFDMLETCVDTNPVLPAFPMNTQSCSNYFGCVWQDFCVAWANPLQHVSHVPFGFTQRYWDPRELETTHKMEL